jgi:putative GTP pyrophosphokinase
MKKIWISLLNTDYYIRNDIKERKHGMIIDELKKQGKALLDARRDNFVRQSLLSDEFLNFMQQNKKPFDLLMSYYECAIMEIETKY